MNITFNHGNLYELKARLKNKFPCLTDSDLNYPEDDQNDMLTMVAYKLRKSKEEMQNIIKEL